MLSRPVSTKYHRNIPKGIRLTQWTRNQCIITINITMGDKAKSKKGMSFLYATRRFVIFYISTKYHQNIPKSIQITERTRNPFQTKQREITTKVRKSEMSFLYASRRLILFYITTMYRQCILKVIQATAPTFTPAPTVSVPKQYVSSPNLPARPPPPPTHKQLYNSISYSTKCRQDGGSEIPPLTQNFIYSGK